MACRRIVTARHMKAAHLMVSRGSLGLQTALSSGLRQLHTETKRCKDIVQGNLASPHAARSVEVHLRGRIAGVRTANGLRTSCFSSLALPARLGFVAWQVLGDAKSIPFSGNYDVLDVGLAVVNVVTHL
jgi:hypothetical protein